ncbi:hypothetical protein Lal_00047768 [Lupinus albus]|nr:hypothetical protein Lal_00047768 [Lupinus albus]
MCLQDWLWTDVRGSSKSREDFNFIANTILDDISDDAKYLIAVLKESFLMMNYFSLHYVENATLMNPHEPCCAPLKVGFKCGNVGEKGNKKYTLCEKPKLFLYWDNLHPFENGWHFVFMQLEPSLSQIIGGKFSPL